MPERMTTGAHDGARTPRRREARLGAVLLVLEVLIAYALVALVAGLVWEAVWAPPDQVVQQHQVYPADYESLRRIFTGTGLYVIVAAVGSSLTALVISLLTRRRELLVLVAVALGSGVAAGVMREVGISRGPVDPTTLAADTANGVHLPGALDVSGFSPYLVWPMTSLLVLALVFFAWPRNTDAGAGGRHHLETDDPTEPSVSERSHR
jgi:hypothetical protein